MKHYPYKDLVALHRELWKWIAETGSNSKKDWPGWKDFNICDRKYMMVSNWCFGCAFDIQANSSLPSSKACTYCPFLRTRNRGTCLGGLYPNWTRLTTLNNKKAQDIALKIANLPLTKKAKELIQEEELSG